MDLPEARRLLEECFAAALAAVEPETGVARALRRIELTPGPVSIFAIGKAAPAMTRGVPAALTDREVRGIAVSDHAEAVADGVELIVAGHPVPDERSIVAGRALLDQAASLGPDDGALALISGGGSALAEVPAAGVTLDDLRRVNELLLRSGASIDEVNAVRKRLSRFKGGGLGAALAVNRLVTLVLSDVVGDRLDTIASGPTFPDGSRPGDALAVLRRYDLEGLVPDAVRSAVRRPPTRFPALEQEVVVVGSGATAARGAAVKGRDLGLRAAVVDTRIVGEAVAVADEVIDRCDRNLDPGAFDLGVFAGETTVTVTGDGVGGRNQEAALAVAIRIRGRGDLVFLAGGTDGIDGATTAAGAIVDGSTVDRGRELGMDAAEYLDRNDSGTFLARVGDQLVTGPTGTNVGDVWLCLSR